MDREAFDQAIKEIGYECGINGRDEYLNSVVLVPLILINNTVHVLFERRSGKIRQGGEICFPGGRVDQADRTLQETALRETEEELGIPTDKIKIVGRLDKVIAPLGVIVDAFVGLISIEISEIKLNKWEVEELIVLPLDYFLEENPQRYKLYQKVHPSYLNPETGQEVISFPAKELGVPEKYWKPWGHFEYNTAVYQTPQGVIWGITARLIIDLIQRIKGGITNEC